MKQYTANDDVYRRQLYFVRHEQFKLDPIVGPIEKINRMVVQNDDVVTNFITNFIEEQKNELYSSSEYLITKLINCTYYYVKNISTGNIYAIIEDNILHIEQILMPARPIRKFKSVFIENNKTTINANDGVVFNDIQKIYDFLDIIKSFIENKFDIVNTIISLEK